jgi:DnaJ family protein B protein 12
LAAALTTPDPKYSFVKSSHYSYERVTGGVSVHYFVNPTQFAVHPIYTTSHPTGGDTTKTPVVMRSSGSSASPTMRRFEKGIEERWVNWKYGECVKGKERLARKVDAMTGLFGIGTDWEAVRKLQKEQIESCEELRSKGYQV